MSERFIGNIGMLRACRQVAGISQKRASTMAGQRHLWLWVVEKGEEPISISEARTLAELYEVPFALFFLPRVPRWRMLGEWIRRRMPSWLRPREDGGEG